MPTLASFPQFLELPEEIRELIYIQYLADLKQPVEPPITRASQLLRKETLPLFYKVCPLKIRTLIDGGSHGLRCDRPHWYHSLGDKLTHLRMLKLQFDFGKWYVRAGDEPFSLTYTVYLDEQRNSYSVECAQEHLQVSEDERRVLLQALKSVLDGFVAEGQIGHIDPQDIDELVDVCFAVEEWITESVECQSDISLQSA